MAGSPRSSLGNVRFDMDINYPEHLSRLHRHSILTEYPKSHFIQKKNIRNRRGNRYRTQPVTFDEIQEVDEENTTNEIAGSNETNRQAENAMTPSELQLNFFHFSKELDQKRKIIPSQSKEDSIDSDGITSNGEQALPQCTHQDQWTECVREGSV